MLAIRSVAVALAMLTPAVAHSATLEGYFTAAGFVEFFGSPEVAPVDPVTGHIAINFDPSLTYVDETSGITVSGLNIIVGSPIAFNYNPVTDQLVFGGLSDGANALVGSPNDFFASFFNASTSAPVANNFVYTQANGELFFSATKFVIGVPEPASWALMISGFGLIGASMRGRTRKIAIRRT